MKTINDEIILKKELDKLGVRYADLDNTWKFYVEFVDNKSYSVIYNGMFNTPISSIRMVNDVLKKAQLPIEDMDIVLRYAHRRTGETFEFVSINFVLDPYLYFTKKTVESVTPKDNTSNK